MNLLVSTCCVALQILFSYFILIDSVLGDYYAGYVSSILQNQTKSSCDGDYLYIRCPIMTTIAIQGAMYGRQVPSSEMCSIYSSILNTPATLIGKENVDCKAVTSLAKTARECHDRRVCQLLVQARIFGQDPCPHTTKYLTVNYKCRILHNELRSRSSCKDTTLRLRCPRPNKVLAVYNVSIEDNQACGYVNKQNCSVSQRGIVDYVASRCHNQRLCSLAASTAFCGNYLSVEYACLPRRVLTNKIPSLDLATTVSMFEEAPESTASIPVTAITDASDGDHENFIIKPKINTPIAFPRPTFRTQIHTSSVKGARSVNTSLTTHDYTYESSSGDETTVNQENHVIAFATSTTAKPTLPHVPTGRELVVAENEFAPPVGSDLKTTSLVAPHNEPITIDSVQSSVTSTNISLSVVMNVGNFSVSAEYSILHAIVQTMAYFKQKSDRVLVILLGSICICLLLTVFALLFRCEDSQVCNKVAKVTLRRDARETEAVGFFSTAEQSRQSHAEITAAGPASNSNNNTRPVNRFPYINRYKNRNRRSRKHSFLNRWCSCCCTIAPWQREHSCSDNVYNAPGRSNSDNEDDIISVVPSERNQSENELLRPFPTTLSSANEGNLHGFYAANQEEVGYADNTSEYEYPDNDVTTPASFNSHLTQSNQYTVPVAYHAATYDTNPTQSIPTHHVMQELPPFPKPMNRRYEVEEHNFHSRDTGSLTYNAPKRQRTSSNHYPVQYRQHHTMTSHFPNFNDQYVSLQPQMVKPLTSNFCHVDVQAEQSRDSFYDNSLPRDSPIYEYYQRQQRRQELPGTRNINKYYS